MSSASGAASTSGVEGIRRRLAGGLVIPAHPLALTEAGKLDEISQRALSRYYLASGAKGLAVGVHTTQFAIRQSGLLRPVLELAAEEVAAAGSDDIVRIAGICGPTSQAVAEASTAVDCGYDAGLLSLAALSESTLEELIDHSREVAQVLPVIGFYLQPAVGGRVLDFDFWRRFAEIEAVVAIKMAPFNRYQTLDVVRAVVASGRAAEISLYTGNDDNIVIDLLTTFSFPCDGKAVQVRMAGGLLGHWACWTKPAVELLAECQAILAAAVGVPDHMLTRAAQVTDANAAFFDVANQFAGCIPGIHEVLRRQGLMKGLRCLDPEEVLSPGQAEEIDRVYRAYPHLNDDDFVAEHRDEWFS
jgi:hypothetical protein